MKENFQKALELMLKHEGGFTDDKRDPGNKNGGSTNLGVTQAVYEQWIGRKVTHEEMKALKPENVAPIYKHNYWKRLSCDQLPAGLDFFCFTYGVNAGTGRSAKTLQGLIGAKQDGGIGPKTLAMLERHGVKDLLQRMHDKRQGFYEGLNTFKHFGNGWTRRNKEELNEALELMRES
jgi:lysozyme family protein